MNYSAIDKNLPERIINIYSTDRNFLVFETESTLHFYLATPYRTPIFKIDTEGRKVINVSTSQEKRIFVLYGYKKYVINRDYRLSDVDFLLNEF